MNERYKIIKQLYSNYLIFIKKKDKLILYGIDKEIESIFKKETINYLILDNLDIEEIKEYKNNKYDEFYVKTNLIKVLRERLIK